MSMNILSKIQHLKFLFLGDKQFEETGNKEIHCSRCDTLFTSYLHLSSSGYTYDRLCKKCKKLKIRELIENGV